MTATTALNLTEQLLGLALLLQTLEFFAMGKANGRGWIWLVLGLQFLATLMLLIHPTGLAIETLFVTHLAICLRWRGSFNGGSDFMILMILSALVVLTLLGGTPAATSGVLAYIGIQTVLSYFVGGIVKLRRSNWRKGLALPGFLRFSIYQSGGLQRKIEDNPSLARTLSWLALAFECSFPVALLSPQICVLSISAGLIFHFANFYFFGLNRFFWAWLAAYPALYYLSGLIAPLVQNS